MKLPYKFLLLIVCILSAPYTLSAQCAMCRAALATGNQQNTAEGINHGITYLMVFPYLLAAILGFVVYRITKKEKYS